MVFTGPTTEPEKPTSGGDKRGARAAKGKGLKAADHVEKIVHDEGQEEGGEEEIPAVRDPCVVPEPEGSDPKDVSWK